MLLAALTSVSWGFAFVAIRYGLDSFSAPQLTALRFLVACVPVLWVPRPRIPWTALLLLGLTLFLGQFLLLFLAFSAGLPPGLASVSVQMHVFFTVLLAAVLLREVPTARQVLGMTVAFAGLALIGWSVGAELRAAALLLALAGAFSWAVGNLLLKRLPAVPMVSLVVWCSLVPPLPALLLASRTGGSANLAQALLHASWPSLAAVVYLGVVATVLAYAAWGHLLQRYPAAAVAPFALLSPCTGVLASAAVFGEFFSPLRTGGMALILGGLAVILLPAGWLERVGLAWNRSV